MLTPSPGAHLGLWCLESPLASLSRMGIPHSSVRGTSGRVAHASPSGSGSGGGVHTHAPNLRLCPGWGVVGSRLLPPSYPLPHHAQKVAYTTVLQEWLRLACRSDAHPELVRRHLVTFRAMSARLLDYVVNIADSNGNTALHYSVSHANFPVVRQLLDSGEPDKRPRRLFDGLMAETLPSLSLEDIPASQSGGGDTVLLADGGKPPFQSGEGGIGPTHSPSILEKRDMVLGTACRASSPPRTPV